MDQKRLILVVSSKGGVGKTTFGRLLADAYLDQGIKAEVFDGDGQVGGLARVHTDAAFYDLRSDDDRHILLNSVGSDADVILHDLPGGSVTELTKIVDDGSGQSVDGLVATLADLNVKLTLVHVIDNELESAQSVAKYMELFGADGVDHVAVLNMRESRNAKADFLYWFGYEQNGERKSGKARAAMLNAGGVEFEMPSLQAGARAHIKELNLRFRECADHPDLTITERAVANQFVRAFRKNVAAAAGPLGLK